MGLIEGRAPHYTISLMVAKLTKQIGHYTKEKGLAENSIQKLLLQLAHNAGSMGFKRKDVFDGLQHVLPASYTHEEKLRKTGRILGIMAKEGLIGKPGKGKKWNMTLQCTCAANAHYPRLFTVPNRVPEVSLPRHTAKLH